jgi:membrane protease subunit HflK
MAQWKSHMTESVTPSDRRVQHVAAFGFVLQLASMCTLLWASHWSQSQVIAAVTRFAIAGLPVWAVLYLVFNQVRRVRAEELETVELKRAREAGTNAAIFEIDDEDLLIEQIRLKWLLRWMLPATTILIALVLLIGHFLFWGWPLDLEVVFGPSGLMRAQQPTVMMWFVVGVGFLCFLCARYAMALSRLPDWRLLRAGASYMSGNAVACLALAIALMATNTIGWAEPLLAVIIRVGLVVLGVELAINFVLDFYRPRTPGLVHRPSFDSRLLGLTSEPGGIAKSIAEALNYQFGFEVSSTWFYQLLQRWMFPIVVVTFAAVLALTSIVVVDADEVAVVERFGRQADGAAVLEPGIHAKWPYPIDIVRRAPVKRISELVIGESGDDEHGGHADEAIVWTEAHEFVPELMLLVASRQDKELQGGMGDAEEGASGTDSVAVSLVMVSMPIQYRIKDVHEYLYNYEDPVKLMEEVAYQRLSDFAASVDLDELIGPGRERFNKELRQLIQDRLDELHAGIEIVFVGLRDVHPPAKDQVASTFQSVIAAQTNMAGTVHAAEGEVRRLLTSVAGSESRAKTLDAAIQERDSLRANPNADPQLLEEAGRRVQDLIVGNIATGTAPLSGAAAALIAEARSVATARISSAATKALGFSADMAAFEVAPDLYKQRKLLERFTGLSAVRKYLIVGDPSQVLIIYNTDEQGGLDRVLSEGLEEEGQ